MVVNEVNIYVGLSQHPQPCTGHSTDLSARGKETLHIPGYGWEWGGIPLMSPYQTMLVLVVCLQQPPAKYAATYGYLTRSLYLS